MNLASNYFKQQRAGANDLNIRSIFLNSNVAQLNTTDNKGGMGGGGGGEGGANGFTIALPQNRMDVEAVCSGLEKISFFEF